MNISLTFSTYGGFDLVLDGLHISAIGSSDHAPYPFGWFEIYITQDLFQIKLIALGKVRLPREYYLE
jgi:hypothetical protein